VTPAPVDDGAGPIVVRFVVPGDPVPWTRPLNRRQGGRRNTDAHEAHAGEVLRWFRQRAAVHIEYGPTGDPIPIWPAGTPVSMSIRAHVKRPKGHYGTGRNAGKLTPKYSEVSWCPFKPDIDNYFKLIADALSGWAWADDGQIVTHIPAPEKRYVELGAKPRTDVVLSGPVA
jgi:Holliday junction resolvase RusA-like endonuclease